MTSGCFLFTAPEAGTLCPVGLIIPKGQRCERLKDAFGEKAKDLNTNLEIVTFMVKKKVSVHFLNHESAMKGQQGKRRGGAAWSVAAD